MMSEPVRKGQLTRLKSRKTLDTLFKTKPKFSKELRFYFIPSNEGSLSVAVSAPKRNFKRAVDRIRIKRLMREAIRLEYDKLINPIYGEYLVIFSGRKLPSLNALRKEIKSVFLKLSSADAFGQNKGQKD